MKDSSLTSPRFLISAAFLAVVIVAGIVMLWFRPAQQPGQTSPPPSQSALQDQASSQHEEVEDHDGVPDWELRGCPNVDVNPQQDNFDAFTHPDPTIRWVNTGVIKVPQSLIGLGPNKQEPNGQLDCFTHSIHGGVMAAFQYLSARLTYQPAEVSNIYVDPDNQQLKAGLKQRFDEIKKVIPDATSEGDILPEGAHPQVTKVLALVREDNLWIQLKLEGAGTDLDGYWPIPLKWRDGDLWVTDGNTSLQPLPGPRFSGVPEMTTIDVSAMTK